MDFRLDPTGSETRLRQPDHPGFVRDSAGNASLYISLAMDGDESVIAATRGMRRSPLNPNAGGVAGPSIFAPRRGAVSFQRPIPRVRAEDSIPEPARCNDPQAVAFGSAAFRGGQHGSVKPVAGQDRVAIDERAMVFPQLHIPTNDLSLMSP